VCVGACGCVCVTEKVSVCEREKEKDFRLFDSVLQVPPEREGGRERVCVWVCVCV